MDLHTNAQPESARMEQIVSQFFLKSLHIILNSRIPSLRPHNHSDELSSASRVRRSDKWFSLVLGDRPAALDNLNFWHRYLMDPMIIDIIVVQRGLDSSAAGASVETVIERWVVQYESLPTVAAQAGEISSTSYKKTYKKSIILLRSLYSTMRLLPVSRIFQQLGSSTQTYDFDIIYKVSSFSNPFRREDEECMKRYSFAPVDAFPGRLCVSVVYRPTLSDFNLRPSTSSPPHIITDYVGSSATDPMRAFPSSEKGFHATSFPLRRTQLPSSASFQRPHSWTSGLHKAAPFMQNQPLSVSPPASHTYSVPFDLPTPSHDVCGRNKIQDYRPPANQKATSFDEYQLSPPFSLSPSPSPPSYLLRANHVHTHLRSETAPVTIPLPATGRGPKYPSPYSSDPSRHYLPPLSPKSTKHDHSPQESPSGYRSLRKAESPRTGEIFSGMTNHYAGQKFHTILLHRCPRTAKMIQGHSQGCYLLVAPHILDVQEALVDYRLRMTWMTVTSHVLLLLMMLMHQIAKLVFLQFFGVQSES
ncbi:autophagy-related protein 13a isoform X2 [Malania oleifera]|uniref:autophagy-related protein 13a isoform X2 n=2 Tax=Malania oleifera TaxID=397392 RepID=UPI0025AEC95C|nr:autophagy-related protein 13a isoform X2 [Malania oleifera]